MKRFVSSLLGVAILATSLLASHFPPNVITSVRPLQYVVEGELKNVCTTFSINQDKGYWLTAGHCTIDGVVFGGKPLDIVFADPKVDLAVIRGPHTHNLGLAVKEPEIGDEMYRVGYPNGTLSPLVAFGRLSNKDAEVEKGVHYAITYGDSGPGSSGGPVVDGSGRVVCAEQVGNGSYAGCNPFKVFVETVGKYFGA